MCVGVGEVGDGGEALVVVRDGLCGVRTVTSLGQGGGQPSICVAERQICSVYFCRCYCCFGGLLLLATGAPHNNQHGDEVCEIKKSIKVFNGI